MANSHRGQSPGIRFALEGHPVLGVFHPVDLDPAGELLRFEQGTYNSTTGEVDYTTKLYPWLIDRLTQLHKANTGSSLFFLNIFFGISLLFFVVSAFWMYMPSSGIFKKGMYFVAAGILLTLLMLWV